MFYAFGIFCVAIIAVALLFNFAEDGYSGWHTLSGIIASFGALACLIVGILYTFMAYSWIAAGHKADIINREYHTNYTQAEIFYADDVIDSVRQLQRQRIEVNGDLMQQKKDE